jgi:predicted permease
MHQPDTWLLDLRYGVRSLRRSPFISCAIVLMLSLGIGVNTAAFTLLNGLLFRARVEKDPQSFIELVPEYSNTTEPHGPSKTSVEDYRAYLARARSVTGLAAWERAEANLNDDPKQSDQLLVTCSFFSVYGLEHAKLGRLFLPEECSTPGAAPVAVISEEMWQLKFDKDPRILGQVITLNRHPFTVVGVVPARFPGRLQSGVWLPWTMQALFDREDLFRKSEMPWLTVQGRLNAGFSRSAAQAELGVIANQQDKLHPGRKTTLTVTNGSLIANPRLRSVVIWMVLFWWTCVTLVLLMACTNVATLLLSRAAGRRQEIAIRLSLGAGRGRLLRMLLAENVILATAAGVISAYLAKRVPDIIRLWWTDVGYFPLKPDLLVFAYLGAIVLLTAFVAGMAPAKQSLKVDLVRALKSESFLGSGSPRWGARSFLITAQIAMSLFLMTAAALIIRTDYNLFTADAGMETRQLLVIPLNAEAPRYTNDTVWSFYRTVEQRVRALPSVQSTCYTTSVPFMGVESTKVWLPGEAKGTGRRASIASVSPDFFQTVRIPIMLGRAFQAADVMDPRAASLAIVSETFARTFWPGANPLGKRIEADQNSQFEVVGIARDTKLEAFNSVEGPHFYLLQHPGAAGGDLMLRFHGDAGSILRGVDKAVRELDRDSIGVPRILRSMIVEEATEFLLLVEIFLLLGGLAILLAVVGIFGVTAFDVTRRTRELGIRVALGATKADIFRFILASGARPIVAGLSIGLLLTLAASVGVDRMFNHVFDGLGVRDPIIYAAVSLLLVLTALAAMFGPALRAAKSDPMRALRHE